MPLGNLMSINRSFLRDGMRGTREGSRFEPLHSFSFYAPGVELVYEERSLASFVEEGGGGLGKPCQQCETDSQR